MIYYAISNPESSWDGKTSWRWSWKTCFSSLHWSLISSHGSLQLLKSGLGRKLTLIAKSFSAWGSKKKYFPLNFFKPKFGGANFWVCSQIQAILNSRPIGWHIYARPKSSQSLCHLQAIDTHGRIGPTRPGPRGGGSDQVPIKAAAAARRANIWFGKLKTDNTHQFIAHPAQTLVGSSRNVDRTNWIIQPAGRSEGLSRIQGGQIKQLTTLELYSKENQVPWATLFFKVVNERASRKIASSLNILDNRKNTVLEFACLQGGPIIMANKEALHSTRVFLMSTHW